MLGKSCIIMVVTSQCIELKLEKRKTTGFVHSRLEVLQGKTPTRYPRFIQNSPWTNKCCRAKIQVGFHQLYLSLFTLCAVKGFVWFRVLKTRTSGETVTRIRLRNRTEEQARGPLGACECIYKHLYTEKKVFTPVQKEQASVYIHKKAPPFPSMTVYYWQGRFFLQAV